MVILPSLAIRWCRTALALALGLALGGCAMSGHDFHAADLATLTPGRSTLIEATHTLGAAPQRMYYQTDGSVVAVWEWKFSVIPDALYHRKEAVLQFGVDGRLSRLVDTVNVPLSRDSRTRLLGAYVPSDSPAPGQIWQPAPLQ